MSVSRLGSLWQRPLRRLGLPSLVLVTLTSWAAPVGAPRVAAAPRAGTFRFDISFARAARSEPVTGRVYVAISRDNDRTPIEQTGPTGVPLFAVDVNGLRPGEVAVIDDRVFGHPVQGLADIPPGDYWVQAFVNVYTRFDRADRHTVWLHMDRWEGQNWKRSPGNLFSDPLKVRIEPSAGGTVQLVCARVIPPVDMPPDTEYVRRITVTSGILSKWWGQPITLGATVLLPKDYDRHPEARYPVNYVQGHFSLRAPAGSGQGGGLDSFWLSEDTPRFVYVTLQHPSPYYDNSYGVNSANNGPYGDAIMQELIPEVEKRFRIISEPWARQVSGGSTGGWIALAHQIFYPDFYGGAWASCPDPVDFRSHQIVNIYEDENAYWLDMGWAKVERPNRRRPDGAVLSMMKDENWYELVAGNHSRSGGQWDIWEATYSPVGPDGYPARIWDKRTGVIDHRVAQYWKEHYDLRHILETRWGQLGPKLAAKLHISVGAMDSYYLNNAASLMDAFLRSATNPRFGGEVVFQPGAPHCWGPSSAELLQEMTAHIERTALAGADLKSWRYR